MDTFTFCKSCTTCQQAKCKSCTHRAPLGHITAGSPFEIVAIDIMGPLTTTNSGKSYILVVIDYYTKWIEIFALTNIQALTVAKCIFNNVISRYGTPEQIHTDQGTQFESSLFKELCTLLHIHKSRTTPYHPAGDGLVERSNRTIQNILKTAINNNYKDWDLYLPSTMLAYNTSVHSTTGYTPHYLMFGREARVPLQTMYPLPHGHTDIPITQFIESVQHRLHEAYITVRQRMEQSHRYAKQLYDRRVNASTLNIEQLVWLHTHPPPGVSPKLYSHWTGPYKILHKPTPLTYTIQHLSASPRTFTVHRNRLKPYNIRPTVLTPPKESSTTQSTSQPTTQSSPPSHRYNLRNR